MFVRVSLSVGSCVQVNYDNIPILKILLYEKYCFTKNDEKMLERTEMGCCDPIVEGETKTRN